MAIGVYPGSFNPPTIAHLAIARAALEQCGLDRVDFMLSYEPLGKHHADLVSVADRASVLADIASTRPWLGYDVTNLQLIAEIAEDYDVIVLGADKWNQVIDPAWYGDDLQARDAAVASLPTVACAPRVGHEPPHPDFDVVVLDLDSDHGHVSASGVRDGELDWMLPEAFAFAERTGAWTDPDRYARHLSA